MGRMKEVMQDIESLLTEGVDCSTVASTLNVPLDWVVECHKELADHSEYDYDGQPTSYDEYQDLHGGDDYASQWEE